MKAVRIILNLCLLFAVSTFCISCGDDDDKLSNDEKEELNSSTKHSIFSSIYGAADEIQQALPTGTLTNYKHNSKFGSGYAIVNGTVSKNTTSEKFSCTIELVNFSRGEGKTAVACTGKIKFSQSCFPNSTKKQASRNLSFNDLKVESSEIYDVISGAMWKNSDTDAYATNVKYTPYQAEATGRLGIAFSYSGY